MSKPDARDEARALLLACYDGVLSTQSVAMPGYPFGSVVPFCLDRAGQPVILSIRPEALTFHHVIDSPNRLSGQIVDTTYLGATAQYQIQVANGPLIKMCEFNPHGVRLPSSEEIRVMASMSDVVIIRK